MSTQDVLDKATAEALLIARELGFPSGEDLASTLPIDPLLAGHLQMAQELLKTPVRLSDFAHLSNEPRE